MGDANEVLQQFSNGTLSRLDDTEFYYDPNRFTREGRFKQQYRIIEPEKPTTISKSITSFALNVVSDFASGVKSRYNKNQIYAPYEFKDTIDAYQKALEETKNDFQHIPSPPTSQQRRPENKKIDSKKVQTRFLIQNNNNNNSIRQLSSSSFTSTVHNIKPSRESIKKDIEQFQPPSTWSTLPKHKLFIKYPTVITMEELMNQLKHEVERYTYLLDDTEKVMKDYENDIDETLNNLQDLENKIKEMNTKTVAYAEQQLNMRSQLNIIMNNNKNDKNARRIQHKLNEKIDKWKSRKDPLVQLSNILTTHEQLITLNKLTDRFWNIIYYIILGIIIIIIMLLLWLPHLTP
ncbi:hypothetical protein BJ944DRAFT_251692 [Cunninghamella echinulata]|nr:hypothetical protein BJ944DRAFT_251692 [Cunninghamella echinulata]